MAEALDPLALVEREGIVALTAAPGLVSLVESVAGGPVRGSWWSHPRGHEIYAHSERLAASESVLVAKLVDGKVAFLHRRLWPALWRVVGDRGWRTRVSRSLDEGARRLLRLTQRRGRVRVDSLAEDPKALRRARKALERSWLVHSTQIHTDRGRHASVLVAWRQVLGAEVRHGERGLAFEEALRRLRVSPETPASHGARS